MHTRDADEDMADILEDEMGRAHFQAFCTVFHPAQILPGGRSTSVSHISLSVS